MATGAKGGVGIRLFIAGADVVKRGFAEVADSGSKMWAQIALGEKAANPALVALSRASNEAQGAVDGLARRAGGANSVLSAFGVGGVAVAAGLGAAALALSNVAKTAQELDDLDATATRLHTTAEALQELHHAGQVADVSVQDVDSAIANLDASLGAMQSNVGNQKLKAAFEALKLTPEQLDSLQTGSDLLPIIADRLATMGTEAEKTQLARKLGVEALLPLLEKGADGIAALRQQARDLGLVLDGDTVTAAADFNEQIRVADERVKAASRAMDAELVPSLAGLKTAFADAITWAAELLKKLNQISEWKLQKDRETAASLRQQADAIPDSWGEFGRRKKAKLYLDAATLAGTFQGDNGYSGAVEDRVGTVQDYNAANPTRDRPLGGGGGGGGRAARAGRDTFTGALPAETLAAIADGRMTEADARRMLAAVPDDARVIIVNTVDATKAETPQQISERTKITDALAAPDQNVTLLPGAPNLVRGPFGAGLMSPEDKDAWARDIGDATAAGLDAALHGDFTEFLKQQLYRAALEGLSTAVSDALKNADIGGSGGGFWASVLSAGASIFGGGRAGGGGVGSGMWVNAGEHGRTELAMIGGNGYVADHEATKRMIREAVAGGGASGARGAQRVEIISRVEIPAGYVSDRALGGLFETAHRRAVAEAVATTQAAAPGSALEYQFQKG